MIGVVGPVGCGKTHLVKGVVGGIGFRVLHNPFGDTEFSSDDELITAAIDGAICRERQRCVVVVDDWMTFSERVRKACIGLSARRRTRCCFVVVTNAWADLPECVRKGKPVNVYAPSASDAAAILRHRGLRLDPDTYTGDVRQAIMRAELPVCAASDRAEDRFELVRSVCTGSRRRPARAWDAEDWAFDTLMLNMPRVLRDVGDIARVWEWAAATPGGRGEVAAAVRHMPRVRDCRLDWGMVQERHRARTRLPLPDAGVDVPALRVPDPRDRLFAAEVLVGKIAGLPAGNRQRVYRRLGVRPDALRSNLGPPTSKSERREFT